MKKSILPLILLLLQGFLGFAGIVKVEDAQKTAIHFFSSHYMKFNPLRTGISIVTETNAIFRDNKPLYYIFNMSPCGWIAVSAQDAAWPVLAYSFEGSYTGENLPPQYIAWMKQYEGALFYMAMNPVEAPSEISSAWKALLDDGYKQAYKAQTSSAVAPLLYSLWDQGLYYNGNCPADIKGPGGHTYSGCVPTAMGQIMNYYRWPVTGTGSYSYTDPPYGVLSADFGATTYNWDNMPDNLTGPNDGIATLLYHLGVSCDLVYGPGGSGMYNHKAAFSLRNYFKYSPQTQYLFRDSTSLRWDSVIVAHLNRGMPLYYAGWSLPNVNGHAWVCDGYQDTTYFHFNWGWSGTSNGYFYTGNPSPPGNNFRLAQELIINFFPDTVNYTYPAGCEGTKTLQFLEGSFSDGSGPVKPYSGTADCSWLISPQTPRDSVSNIILSFDYFDTNPSDTVKIFDGHSGSSPLLGSYSGNTLPPSISSTGNKLFIHFKANGGTPGNGFKAGFASRLPVWCNGTQVIQADTADFTNGSYGFNYSDNSFCKWRLLRNDTLPLTIYFKRFDTEPLYDNLTIYDISTGMALDTLSGHYDSTNLPGPVTAPGGKMFLIFSTNSSITGKGWEIYYPRKSTGIQESSQYDNLVIYPNPCSALVNLRFSSSRSNTAELILSSPDGRAVLNRQLITLTGENTIQINVTGLPAGLYFISLKTINTVQTGKLIISKP